MGSAALIKALRYCAEHEGCDYYIAKDCPRESTWMCGVDCNQILMLDAAAALEAAEKRIVVLEDELRFQLDTRRKETAEIERLKAENLKLQKQNRDCGWNCKQCEYVDKDLQAEESEQRLMELDRRLYELRSFNAKMRGEHDGES